MAIATRDGSVVYDVAFALVTTTKDTVLNGNEAYAFASCTRCAAVAVSFQVVLIIGNAHVIVPKNVSAAVAYNCISCLTAAIAIQLDISLTAAPHGSPAAQLAALWKQVRAFGKHLTSFSVAEINAQLRRYERQIEQILQPLAATSSPTAVSTTGPPVSAATPSPSFPGSFPPATSTGTGTPNASASESPTSSKQSPQPTSSPSDTGTMTSEPPSGTATPSSDPASSPIP
jgi:putative peptide zinc metalloprotease protein